MSDCTTALNQDTTQESVSNYLTPDKTVPRRTSSIFNRESFGVTDTSFSSVLDRTVYECQNVIDDYDFDVQAYIQRLKNEEEDWNALHKERKQKYRVEKRKLKSLDCEGVDINDFLTEEDKKYCDERPDYERIGNEAVRAINRLCMCLKQVQEAEKSTLALVDAADKASNILKRHTAEKSCFM